jgi:hypothetical protein
MHVSQMEAIELLLGGVSCYRSVNVGHGRSPVLIALDHQEIKLFSMDDDPERVRPVKIAQSRRRDSDN